MTGDLAALVRHLLGPHVSVVAGRVDELQGPLWPEETDIIARAVASRRADFTAGRTAARRAMALMGFPHHAIPQGRGGAPVWPEGLAGSLTHGGGVCLAVVGRSDAVRSIGVDLEPLEELDPTVVAEICTQQERDWIATLPDSADLPLRMFTAKEATYKALYPLTGEVMGFDALDVRIDVDGRSFTARLKSAQGPFSEGQGFTGGQGILSGYVVSALRIDRKPL